MEGNTTPRVIAGLEDIRGNVALAAGQPALALRHLQAALLYRQNDKGRFGLHIGALAVLAEARMDDEVLTGAQLEGVISGRDPSDCDEAAGATRVKRLRDSLGNQLVSELLVKTIARKGYVLAVGKDLIRMI